MAMQVQVVTFELNGITEEEYHEACRVETDTFAALPGLLAKIWIKDEAANTFGAVYLWRDQDSHAAYVKGDIFKSIVDDPTLSNVTSKSFDVYDDLTKATQPGLTFG
jgi:hypothetical protein